MGLVAIILWLAAAAVSGVLLFLSLQAEKHRRYFKKKGVPYIGAGTLRLIRFLTARMSLADAEMILYKEANEAGAAGKSKVTGYSDSFVAPAFYVTDLDLTRDIYVKNFENFVDRRKFSTETSDLLLKRMLIALEGETWKGTRSKLSPTFTTGKIRRMFGIFDKSSQRMCDYLRKNVGPTGDFDICEAYSKYAMDVIASCAFGIDSKSFEGQPGIMSEFEEMGSKFQFRFKATVFFKFMLLLIAPKVADFLGIQAFDLEPQKYFIRVIKEVMKHRRETGERQDDFLQLMMDAQKGLLKSEENSKESLEVMTGTEDAAGKANASHFTQKDSDQSPKVSLDDDDIVSNSVLFLIGGFDTTQSLLIFAAYQLALEQEVQERLLNEVTTALENNGGKLTYECVQDMTYLDMVINETLRYFPPAMRTERLCTKDYNVPGTDIVIEKGVLVSMPVIGMHRDPKYYDNPEKFDPERFLPERKSERHPYAFATFGHGPRNCIGMRFALTKVKAVVATLVYNFKLQPCSQTEIPVQFGNTTTLKPKNGMWLNITPRPEREQ